MQRRSTTSEFATLMARASARWHTALSSARLLTEGAEDCGKGLGLDAGKKKKKKKSKERKSKGEAKEDDAAEPGEAAKAAEGE